MYSSCIASSTPSFVHTKHRIVRRLLATFYRLTCHMVLYCKIRTCKQSCRMPCNWCHKKSHLAQVLVYHHHVPNSQYIYTSLHNTWHRIFYMSTCHQWNPDMLGSTRVHIRRMDCSRTNEKQQSRCFTTRSRAMMDTIIIT